MEEDRMQDLKRSTSALLALTVAATGVVATAGAVTAQDDGCTIAMSWREFQEERWALRDKPAMVSVIEEAGCEYIEADAGNSPEKQFSDIEQLINQGADVIMVLAADPATFSPAIDLAEDNGVQIIAYDQLIEDPRAFYITFDNVEVGRMQARAIQELVPEGNYVFIKGSPLDPNADFLHGGQVEVLQEALDSGAIVNVGEQYTDGWDPATAQDNMAQILTANDNNVDAVVASNDGTAGGVVAALAEQGLEGVVPVSGQDADNAALNRVARGTQAVSVWKDSRVLGAEGAKIALQLIENGGDLAAVEGATIFSDGANGVDMNSILLAPIPITQDNLNLMLEAEWLSQEELCAGVEAGSVDVCP
jgi:D-xylose transport system substrate-binding protein